MKAKKEESWQQRIRRNELILQSAGEGICGIDLLGKISFANPASLKMLGQSSSDLLKMHYNLAFFNKEPNNFEDIEICPIQFALTDGETSHVNTETFFRQDGSDFLVEYICVPLIENEKVIGAVLTFQDITERRDLEIAVAQARDAALKVAQTKAYFLANMSHEVRTPLNGIIGMTSLLMETTLSNEQVHYSQTIKKSAELLLEIVNDILDFSKIEAGKLELEKTEFDLNELIEETIRIFNPEAKRKNISLNYKLDKKHKLIGDDVRLRQVLNNLISNAIKFTEKGSVLLKILENVPNNFRFEVIDTGIGIAKNNQDILFQPFMQADSSTARHFGGTGLGLAICKQITTMLGGQIGVESEFGKGSTFWFTAKFEKCAKSKKTKAKSGKLLMNKEQKSLIKILIAEDNPINQQVALGMLRSLDFLVEAVSSGSEAVNLFKKNKYDVILMDCQMPEMDGYETTKAIRLFENGGKNIKIIAMTANVGNGEKEKCLAAGMDDYLGKPFTKESLLDILEKNLSEKNKKNLDSKENISQHFLANLLEPEALKNLLEIESRGEKNFVIEMLNLFIDHAEIQINQINNALTEKNRVGLEKTAHSLKGSSGSIGLNKMLQICSDLEKKSPTESWQILEKQVDLITKEFNLTKKLITEKELAKAGDL